MEHLFSGLLTIDGAIDRKDCENRVEVMAIAGVCQPTVSVKAGDWYRRLLALLSGNALRSDKDFHPARRPRMTDAGEAPHVR